MKSFKALKKYYNSIQENFTKLLLCEMLQFSKILLKCYKSDVFLSFYTYYKISNCATKISIKKCIFSDISLRKVCNMTRQIQGVFPKLYT